MAMTLTIDSLAPRSVGMTEGALQQVTKGPKRETVQRFADVDRIGN
jgi:hypothetical protein